MIANISGIYLQIVMQHMKWAFYCQLLNENDFWSMITSIWYAAYDMLVIMHEFHFLSIIDNFNGHANKVDSMRILVGIKGTSNGYEMAFLQPSSELLLTVTTIEKPKDVIVAWRSSIESACGGFHRLLESECVWYLIFQAWITSTWYPKEI